MAFKRYNIEIGQGVDVHGADTNNAVKKALADAMHHCCMAGMSEIHGITWINRAGASGYRRLRAQPRKKWLSRWSQDTWPSCTMM